MHELPRFIKYNKEIGETPLEALNRLKAERPELNDIRLAYAGRLDPQASGELLILVGDECKNRDHYQGLDKTYTFDLLVGFSTDTGDIMGLIDKIDLTSTLKEQDLEQALLRFIGTVEQKFPIYSSQTVDGKPLWKWAKEGRVDEIKIPEESISLDRT